jgi:hypothetical protein
MKDREIFNFVLCHCHMALNCGSAVSKRVPAIKESKSQRKKKTDTICPCPSDESEDHLG